MAQHSPEWWLRHIGISTGKTEYTSGLEITKHVKKTDVSKFQQLYSCLEKEEAFGYYEQITPEIWDEFRRDAVLEGLVSIRFSKMERMVSAANEMSALAEVISSVSGESIIDNKAMEAINGFRALEQMRQSKGIPCVLTFTKSPEFKLIAYLNRGFLKVDKEQVVGDLNLFCKIQRMAGKNGKIELMDFLSEIKNMPMNLEQRGSLSKNLVVPPEFRDIVRGPAAVVIPVAVYR